MSRPAVLAPEARQDLRRILDRFDDPVPARRLRDLVVVTTARRIGQRPLLGRVEPRLVQSRFRVWSVPSFSLLVVYNATTDPVRIVRIVHTAQDLPKVLESLRF